MITCTRDDWRNLLPYLPVISITDPTPEATAGEIAQSEIDAVSITPEKLTREIKDALISREQHRFYDKFCSPALLIAALPHPDNVLGDAVQFELAVILSVRRVNRLPTLFVFPDGIPPSGITNTSLRTFLLLDECRHQDCTLTDKPPSRFMDKIKQCIAQLNDDPLEDEEDEGPSAGCATCRAQLDEIELQLRTLQRAFSRTVGGTDPPQR